MNKMDEKIIVVPRTALFEDERLAFQGYVSDKDLINKIIDNIDANMGVMRRGNAEEDPRFKQPIPYAVLRRGDEVFVYERLVGGGESRLHGKLSIGAGGHMNYDGANFREALMINLNRELHEELIFKSQDEVAGLHMDVIGIINDDQDEVGKVHVGLLVVFDISSGIEVEVREKEQLEGRFMKIEDLKKPEAYNRLENWSKIVADIL